MYRPSPHHPPACTLGSFGARQRQAGHESVDFASYFARHGRRRWRVRGLRGETGGPASQDRQPERLIPRAWLTPALLMRGADWSASMPELMLLNDHSLPSYLASRLLSRPRAAANMVARSVRDMLRLSSWPSFGNSGGLHDACLLH